MLGKEIKQRIFDLPICSIQSKCMCYVNHQDASTNNHLTQGLINFYQTYLELCLVSHRDRCTYRNWTRAHQISPLDCPIYLYLYISSCAYTCKRGRNKSINPNYSFTYRNILMNYHVSLTMY